MQDVHWGRICALAALAKAVGPKGKVYAVEISEESVKRLEARKAKDALANLEVIRDTEDDPKLPKAALDGVLMVNTYH